MNVLIDASKYWQISLPFVVLEIHVLYNTSGPAVLVVGLVLPKGPNIITVSQFDTMLIHEKSC